MGGKILYSIFIIGIISNLNWKLANGQDAKPPPAAEYDDEPMTVWDFIWTDVNDIAERSSYNVPFLYKLFIQDWMPPEKPLVKLPPKKRSNLIKKNAADSIKVTEENYLEDVRNLINFLIEAKNKERALMRTEMKKNESDINSDYSKQIELMKSKRFEDSEEVNKYNRTNENGGEIIEENRNGTMKSDDVELVTERIQFSNPLLDTNTTNKDSILYFKRDKKSSFVPRKQKRSVVEEVESPSYCKFFSKCVLTACDCNNVKQVV